MSEMIKTVCPCCHAELWVDPQSGAVVQHKKSEKKNFSSLEELLVKEKEKKEKTDERFLQAKKLEEAKKKKAEEMFRQSLKEGS